MEKFLATGTGLTLEARLLQANSRHLYHGARRVLPLRKLLDSMAEEVRGICLRRQQRGHFVLILSAFFYERRLGDHSRAVGLPPGRNIRSLLQEGARTRGGDHGAGRQTVHGSAREKRE